MTTAYDLWDVETGNMIGIFDSEEEALAIVRELIAANGTTYADVLDLGRQDEAGEPVSIARGRSLVHRAQERVSSPVSVP